MTIINQYDKRTGTTYVYESESYWDKEKKQPRSKRKLIGKRDAVTGEIVPTDGRGKKRTEIKKAAVNPALFEELKTKLMEKDMLINRLTAEKKALEKEHAAILENISNILDKYGAGSHRG